MRSMDSLNCIRNSLPDTDLIQFKTKELLRFHSGSQVSMVAKFAANSSPLIQRTFKFIAKMNSI